MRIRTAREFWVGTYHVAILKRPVQRCKNGDRFADFVFGIHSDVVYQIERRMTHVKLGLSVCLSVIQQGVYTAERRKVVLKVID
jgi:hypothetical protein